MITISKRANVFIQGFKGLFAKAVLEIVAAKYDLRLRVRLGQVFIPGNPAGLLAADVDRAQLVGFQLDEKEGENHRKGRNTRKSSQTG